MSLHLFSADQKIASAWKGGGGGRGRDTFLGGGVLGFGGGGGSASYTARATSSCLLPDTL